MPADLAAGGYRETGSALILALVFVIFVGGAIAALADFVSNDISNTSHFSSSRNLQYAASSATNFAINSIRYTPDLVATLNASPPGACWGGGAISDLTNIDGVAQMDVWCSTSWAPTSAATRVVTFSACADTGDPNQAATCAAKPLLQAVVVFDDYPSGTSAPNPNACVVYCGTGLTINSWAWSPTVPVVTGVTSSPSTPLPTAGGTSISITGSGFVAGTTVNLVEEAGGVVAPGNTVLQATSVVVGSGSSISAISPPVIEGSTYFVTVTTPTGTSAYTGSAVLAYSAKAPVLSGMTPSGGATAGGTGVTITGSGFFAGATVQFKEETSACSGTLATSPAISLNATSVTVVSSTSLTAVAPGILTGTCYLVFVTNPGAGTSALATAPEFTYKAFFPIVFAISPTSGPRNTTTMTIYGSNFLSGAQVNFDAVTTGGNFDNITPSSITPSKIVVTVPNLVAPHTYDVTVKVGLLTTTNTSVFTAS